MPTNRKIHQGLVIIDMQYDFKESFNKRIINECIREIRRAKRLKLPIFIVEYVGCDETVEEIMQAVNGYKKAFFIEKGDDDGSDVLSDFFWENNYYFNSLRICGVNACCCVAETVWGLNEKYPKLRIYLNNKACGTFGHAKRVKYRERLYFGCAEGLKNVKRIMV